MLKFCNYKVTGFFCHIHQIEYSIYIKHYPTKKEEINPGFMLELILEGKLQNVASENQQM